MRIISLILAAALVSVKPINAVHLELSEHAQEDLLPPFEQDMIELQQLPPLVEVDGEEDPLLAQLDDDEQLYLAQELQEEDGNDIVDETTQNANETVIEDSSEAQNSTVVQQDADNSTTNNSTENETIVEPDNEAQEDPVEPTPQTNTDG